MKVKATQLKIEIEERTTAIICNRCSRRVEAEGKFGIVAKMWEIDIHGGFDSHGPLVGDNEILRFAACEECLLAWTATFEIPPECESTMFYNPIPGHRVDTEEAVIVRGGYVYPADTPADFVYPDLEEVEATWPEPGVWRISYTVRDGPDKPWTMWKGLVEILSLNPCDVRTHEPLVVARTIGREPRILIWPLPQWNEKATKLDMAPSPAPTPATKRSTP